MTTSKRRAAPSPPATFGAGGGTTRVACYLRISTDEEHQPFSLGAQETRLGAFIASQPGWEHVKTYTDQFSGAYAERPALDRALRDARLGRYDILLVYRVDRFARSLKVLVGLLEELENVGVAFRSATEPIDTSTPTGRMLVQLLGVFAEFERATIIDRVVAGMERKAARGGWPGGTIPYGLRLDDDKHLAVDRRDFHVVQRIFTRYGKDRAGAATIAAELNADEVPTRTGRRFSSQAVLCILRNRGYLGEVSFRDVTYQDGEPLIDPVLFDKAQALLAERGEAYDRRMREAHPDYLLTGLIVCGKCGRNYVGVAAAGRDHRYRYYACWTRQRYGKDACTGERMRADVIEAAVLDAILAIYADPELIERAVAVKAHEVATSAQLHQDQIAATKAELKKTEAAIERYVHAFESGTVSDDMFGPRVRELGDRARTLRARHNELTEAAIAAAADPPTQADLDALRAELDDMIRHGSDTHRKAVAQTFVKRLLVQQPGVIQPTLLVRGGLPVEIIENGEKTGSSDVSVGALSVPTGCWLLSRPPAR
ncbi:MAG: recombinase family protein [Acidimicrobiales bacterium]